MTRNEVLQKLAQWTGRPFSDVRLPTAVANLDLFEDERSLINRLYYLAVRPGLGDLEFLIFHSDNTFAKDVRGDLVLLTTDYNWPK